MDPISEKVYSYLTKRVHIVFILDRGSYLEMQHQGPVYEWTCIFYVRDAQKQLVIYSIFPGSISKDKRKVMSEYLTRINFQLYVGNFDMDFGDGHLRFRTTLDLTHIELTEALFNHYLDLNLQIMDKYIDGIVGLKGFDLSAKDALDFVNQGKRIAEWNVPPPPLRSR